MNNTAEEAPKSGHAPASMGELMSSAKVLADAAQSGFGSKEGGESFDKAKVAGAAEDILEAAKTYGKLDDTSGIGQYVDKAGDYLHKFESSGSDDAATPAPPTAVKEGSEGAAEVAEEMKEKVGGDAGGADDAINMAKKGLGGFFK